MKNVSTQPEYHTILKIIQRLDRDGLLSKLNGNCVLASDIIQNLLYAEGVNSEIIECQLLIEQIDGISGNSIKLVGYDVGSTGNNHVDTHVIVLVAAKFPMIIDLSVGYLLGDANHAVIAPASSNPADDTLIGKLSVGQYKLYYRKKQKIQLPAIHQKTLLARLQDDFNLRKKYEKIKQIAFLALIVSCVDLIVNSIVLAIKILERL